MTDEPQIWRSYAEVSTHAKRLALETKMPVTVISVTEGWVVVDDYAFPALRSLGDSGKQKSRPNPAYWESPDLKYTREEKERAQAREAMLAADYADEKVRRREHLEDRRKYYRSLTEIELDALWGSREAIGLDQHEIDLLRSILRHIKGITPGHTRSTFWQQHATANEWDFT